jgi:hypothetical protein
VTAGSAGAEVTITGTGFVRQTRVLIGFTEKPVTYVSPTQLRMSFGEAELAVPTTLSLRAFNPAPGGGGSNVTTLEVRAPVPVITSLGETQTIAGQASYTLRVNGTGFVNGSEVRFAGIPRTTRRIAPGTLEVTLSEADLRAAGNFPITVTNPSPGGGTSNALSLALLNGAPAITLLPSQGASAGRSGFTLHVHGTGFVAGSVVRWNGSDRVTQYVGPTRLTATISATDVAQPGTAQITVVNPAPGGGTSGPRPMTIRPIGAATSTIRQLALRARDLAVDSSAPRLYASVIGSVATIGNNVVAIDPASATVTASTFVGSEPGKLALSGDGRFLYVGLNGANAVRRVDLPSLTPGLQWSLGTGLVAGDIGVVPGMPNTVAVARQSPGTSPPLVGITIYDDGVARPVSSAGHSGGNRLEFLDSPSVFYGYNNTSTAYEFFTIGIDATGARHLSERGGLISGFSTDIVGAAGRIYATDGSVVDAEQRTKVGSLPFGAGIAVDPALGRAYVLQVAVSGMQIGVYDLNSFQLLGNLPLPASLFDPSLVATRLVRWGTDGLAYLDMSRLVIVTSPLIGP